MISSAAEVKLGSEFRQPAFGLDDARDIRIRGWSSGQAGAFLCHAIARDPTHLLHHTQRIDLSIVASDGEDAFSALLDLFIALGPLGSALRKRMLSATRPLLTLAQAGFLIRSLASGCVATVQHPPASHSVLSLGVTGRLDLVERTESVTSAEADPLIDAETQIVDGNVDAARATLEAALNESPERDDLAKALIELYVRSADLKKLRATRERLGAALVNRSGWDAAEQRLNQGTQT